MADGGVLQDATEMKRSASASFEKDVSKIAEAEHVKKITKSVQSKKSASKPHDDIDEFPSPIRIKKDTMPAPKPLGPVATNEAPTQKELAAAKAARIRLGYEQPDSAATEPEIPLKCPTGPEPVAVVEVEYLTSAELKPLDNIDETVKIIVSELGTKDWQEMCTALNTVRQIALHHRSECIPLLHELVPAVLKLFKNPRSSVCKTAVLCFGDLLQSLKDEMLPYIDLGGLTKPMNSVLCQLLLKACTDKQFVAEAVMKVLTAMGQELSPIKLSKLLAAYASKHKNPKVRGKAGTLLAILTERMTPLEWNETGLAPLLKVAAVLITDKTPDAREAARLILIKIHSIFHQPDTPPNKVPKISPETSCSPVQEGSVDGAVNVNISVVDKGAADEKPYEEEPYLSDSSDEEEKEPLPSSPWKLFCEEHLTMTQAIAVLKIHST